MASAINSNWETIQAGVRDVERLIGQKEYNASMVKARQTLEFMVKLLAERAGIMDGRDLKSLIDDLYEYHWIKKATYEHYHKIRVIGNQAVHDGNASPYDANTAYHMLSQEVYTFANDYRNAGRGTKPTRSSSRGNASGMGSTSSRGGSTQGSASARGVSAQSASSSRGNSSRGTSSRGSSGMNSASTRSRRRQTSSRRTFTLYDLLRLLVPVLCIVLLISIIRLVRPSSGSTVETTPVASTAMVETTAAPVETTAAVIYRISPSMNSSLNVRPEPNTNNTPIGQLAPGSQVEYVRAHDDSWAVIMYNGQEAYISNQYLITE